MCVCVDANVLAWLCEYRGRDKDTARQREGEPGREIRKKRGGAVQRSKGVSREGPILLYCWLGARQEGRDREQNERRSGAEEGESWNKRALPRREKILLPLCL